MPPSRRWGLTPCCWIIIFPASFRLRLDARDVRLGRQVISWGESTFIPNGINVINPIDVARLRTPGSELREALCRSMRGTRQLP